MFYDVFVELCDKKGVSPSKAALTNGISKTSVTRWKGGAEPNPDILKKLSAYFDVSTDYLLDNEQKNKPVTQSDELQPLWDITKDFSPEERARLVEYARLLALKHKQSEKEP